MHLKSLCLLLAFPLFIFAQQSSTITGKLVGADGNPMPLAHIRLGGGVGLAEFDPSMEDKEFAVVSVQSDGSFEIHTDSLGALVLRCTGVGHTMLEVPLILGHPAVVDLQVQLAPLPLQEDFSEAELRFDFDEVARGKTAPFRQTAPGVYEAEVRTEKPELKYRIVGIGGYPWGISIPSATASGYEYDWEGTYNTIVHPVNGVAKIVLDGTRPRLPRRPVTILFADGQSMPARYLDFYSRFQRQKDACESALQQHVRKGGKPAGFSYDWSAFRKEVADDLLQTADTLLKDELRIELLETCMLSAKEQEADGFRRQIAAVSPRSLAWVYHGAAALYARKIRFLGERYVQSMLETHPGLSFRANLLFHLCSYARQEKKDQEYERYMAMLVQNYPETPAGKEGMVIWERDGPRVGEILPGFSFTSLDSGAARYTNAEFGGKYLLIDFWTTWCGPCVEEVKFLDGAYRRFHGPAFEILSVSCDPSPGNVRHFRSVKWRMPWPNAYVETERQPAIGRLFAVQFPKPMLIGPSGTVLETGDALRGEELELTLLKYLPGK